MKLRDEKAFDDWKEKQKGHDDPMADAYGLAIFSYAERWADLMEAGLEADPNTDFAELAERTSREADTDGITGFMYGAAVSVLASRAKVTGLQETKPIFGGPAAASSTT